MNNEQLKKLISDGEGLTFEFKKATEALPENMFETIVAFFNRSGGEVLLGIDDNKNILGIDEKLAEQYCRQISNISGNPQLLFPTFLLSAKVVSYNNKKLVYLFVPISSQVHSYKGKIYDRSTDGDFVLKTNEQIKQAYLRKSSEYTEIPLPVLTDEPVNVPTNENVPLNVPVNENVPLNVPLNDRQKEILSIIIQNPNVTQVELSVKFELNWETIKRDLAYLQKEGLIKRVGSKKTGYWQITL